MIRDLNIQVTVIRSVVVDGSDVTVIENPTPTIQFMASLDLPRTPRLDMQGAPRNTRPHRLRWRMPPLGPDYLLINPSSRVRLSRPVGGKEYENRDYEIIENPRVLRLGHQDVGVESNMYAVENLYPYTGEVFDGSGASVGTITGLSLLSDRQFHEEHGTYEDFTGYAPPEFFPLFKQNVVLVINGKRYKLTSAILDMETLRVQFTARLSNVFS